jgi:hypothetical protein
VAIFDNLIVPRIFSLPSGHHCHGPLLRTMTLGAAGTKIHSDTLISPTELFDVFSFTSYRSPLHKIPFEFLEQNIHSYTAMLQQRNCAPVFLISSHPLPLQFEVRVFAIDFADQFVFAEFHSAHSGLLYAPHTPACSPTTEKQCGK